MNLLVFGLGYSARHVVHHCAQDFEHVAGTVRDMAAPRPLAEAAEILHFGPDGASPEIEERLGVADVILVSVAPGTSSDPVLARYGRRIAQVKRAQKILYLSTIGVYGDRGGEWVDESALPDPTNERSKVRIHAEKAWSALGRDSSKTVHILRLSGIYGPGRNALVNLAEGKARRIVKPGQVFNRIHVEDIARACAALVAFDGAGDVWNVTDDEPAPPQDVVAFAAEMMAVPPPPEQPFESAEMTPMARSFYGESKRCSNAKLREVLGLDLAYPTYREGIAALWADGEGRIPGAAGVSDTARMPRAGYVTAIDGLRAIAVLSVMVCHLDARWLPGGFTGVDVFFVISGFVVTLSMQDLRFATLREMVVFFYARRLRRIAPALIVMLVAASLATVAFVPNAWLSETIQSTGIAAFFGLSNVVLSAQTEHYFAPRAEFNTFLHTWSLGVEEQFYVLFPFLIAFVTVERLRRGRRIAFAALIALSLASLVLCAALTRSDPVFAFFQLPARFWELGLGMALALTRERWSVALAPLPGIALDALAALGLAGLGATFVLGNDQAFPYPWAVPPVLATGLLIVLVTAAETSRAARALSVPVVAFVGKISYSLYLWHWPVYVIFRWTVGLDALAPRLVAVALVFALSTASYFYVEQPFRHGARWRRLPRGAIVAAGLGALLLSAGIARAAFALTSTLSLSTTRQADIWSPYSQPPADGACRGKVTTVYLDAVKVLTVTPTDCGAPAPRRLLVAGDSHAGAYLRMLRLLAQREHRQVMVYASPGCAFMDLLTPVADLDPACAASHKVMADRIVADARPGDDVFLPSLRMTRYLNQDGSLADDATSPRPAALAEAKAFVAALSARRADVILEAPKPVFKAPPFRCADWFDRTNPICDAGFKVPRDTFEQRRAAVLAEERDLARSYPGVSVWDPAAVLCGKDSCDAFKDGKPLFFDGDHLSGWADEVLLQSFAAHLGEIDAPRPDDAAAR